MADHIRVVSKRAGFRRAGLSHPDHPVFHRRDDLDDAQIVAMKGDPMLIVDDMDPPDYRRPPGPEPEPEPELAPAQVDTEEAAPPPEKGDPEKATTKPDAKSAAAGKAAPKAEG